jgi:hypothetical protein
LQVESKGEEVEDLEKEKVMKVLDQTLAAGDRTHPVASGQL